MANLELSSYNGSYNGRGNKNSCGFYNISTSDAAHYLGSIIDVIDDRPYPKEQASSGWSAAISTPSQEHYRPVSQSNHSNSSKPTYRSRDFHSHRYKQSLNKQSLTNGYENYRGKSYSNMYVKSYDRSKRYDVSKLAGYINRTPPRSTIVNEAKHTRGEERPYVKRRNNEYQTRNKPPKDNKLSNNHRYSRNRKSKERIQRERDHYRRHQANNFSNGNSDRSEDKHAKNERPKKRIKKIPMVSAKVRQDRAAKRASKKENNQNKTLRKENNPNKALRDKRKSPIKSKYRSNQHSRNMKTNKNSKSKITFSMRNLKNKKNNPHLTTLTSNLQNRNNSASPPSESDRSASHSSQHDTESLDSEKDGSTQESEDFQSSNMFAPLSIGDAGKVNSSSHQPINNNNLTKVDEKGKKKSKQRNSKNNSEKLNSKRHFQHIWKNNNCQKATEQFFAGLCKKRQEKLRTISGDDVIEAMMSMQDLSCKCIICLDRVEQELRRIYTNFYHNLIEGTLLDETMKLQCLNDPRQNLRLNEIDFGDNDIHITSNTRDLLESLRKLLVAKMTPDIEEKFEQTLFGHFRGPSPPVSNENSNSDGELSQSEGLNEELSDPESDDLTEDISEDQLVKSGNLPNEAKFEEKLLSLAPVIIQRFAAKVFRDRVLECYLEHIAEQKQMALLEEVEEEKKKEERRREKRKQKRQKRKQKRRRDKNKKRG